MLERYLKNPKGEISNLIKIANNEILLAIVASHYIAVEKDDKKFLYYSKKSLEFKPNAMAYYNLGFYFESNPDLMMFYYYKALELGEYMAANQIAQHLIKTEPNSDLIEPLLIQACNNKIEPAFDNLIAFYKEIDKKLNVLDLKYKTFHNPKDLLEYKKLSNHK